MIKKMCFVVSSIFVLFLLNGCVTGEQQLLKNRVVELEQQLADKDAQLNKNMIESEIVFDDKLLEDLRTKESSSYRSSADVSVKKTNRNIQRALKSAGYYKGSIDGKIGKNTKAAIRAFQRAKGLSADGVVGKRTWAKMKSYL